MSSGFHLGALEPRRLFAVELICPSVQIAAYEAGNGLLSYSIVVGNAGSTDTPAPAIGGIFLSTDKVVNDNNDIKLLDISASETPRFSQKTLQAKLRIPGNTAPGTYYLGAALDIGSKVEESDENNNYSFSSNTIVVPEEFDLAFDGTAGNDAIAVRPGGLGTIDVTVNATRQTYPRERVASLAINGLAGNDSITIDTAIDLSVLISGGEGNDLIRGGVGNDLISGNAGKDHIFGGGGNDRLNGNGGPDQIFGEGGADRLFGYAGDDYLDGGSSVDRIDGGEGRDTMLGQGGNDIFTAADGSIDQLFGGSGDDKANADGIDVLASVTIV